MIKRDPQPPGLEVLHVQMPMMGPTWIHKKQIIETYNILYYEENDRVLVSYEEQEF